MKYINTKAIKSKFHENNKQISKDGLLAIDIKVEQLIEKACRVHNGGAKRVDDVVINYVGI